MHMLLISHDCCLSFLQMALQITAFDLICSKYSDRLCRSCQTLHEPARTSVAHKLSDVA